MAYFPMFIELGGSSCLIVGGGRVAFRKTGKLVPYGAGITVIAPETIPEFSQLEREGQVKLYHRGFVPEDVTGKTLVVAATDDSRLNSEIGKLCRSSHIPVNVADDREACTFIFPALIRRGPLSVGISTGGASPAAALYVKEKIEKLLPEETENKNFEKILNYLAGMRGQVKKDLPDEKQRGLVFSSLFDFCMEKKGPLTEEEYKNLIRREDKHGTK